MPSAHRIPHAIAPFNDYIIPTNTHLQAINPDTGNPYWQDYPGFTLQMATDWNTLKGQWVNTIYPPYQSVNTRTKTVIDNVHNFIVDFTTFAKPLLNLIAANPNGTAQDENIFHLVLDKNHRDPSQSHTPIEGSCYATVQSLGGGEIEVSCRTVNDSSRPSLAEGADSVEVAYRVGEPFNLDEPDTYLDHLYSTAKFIVRINTAHEGQKIYMRFRWYNFKHQSLAGAWSAVTYIVVLT